VEDSLKFKTLISLERFDIKICKSRK